jgi:hypothetical protein
LREAADTRVLARSSDGESRAALAAARAILVSIRSDRLEPWIERVADDLEDTGPAPITRVTTATLTPDAPTVRKSQGSRWP